MLIMHIWFLAYIVNISQSQGHKCTLNEFSLAWSHRVMAIINLI